MANAKPASDNTVMRGRPNAKRQKNPAGTKSPKFSNQGRVMLNASDHSAESVSQVVVRAPFPHEESSSIRPKRVTARIKPIAVVQAKASEKRCEVREAQALATNQATTTIGTIARITKRSMVWVTS
ncbi:MAG: hypothetical protein RL430_2160 [Actinomycetota bacterium]